MQSRIMLVDDANDVQIPVIRQLMVQPADNVQLGAALAVRFCRALENLLVRHDVALLTLQVSAKGAEYAAIDADVGRIEMLVDVVIGAVAVLALADEIG